MKERKGSWGWWAVRWFVALLFAVVLAAVGAAAIWIAATPGADQKRAASYPLIEKLPSMANIAHRGASGHAAENSLQAFELALKAGADVLELDVRQLSDGSLVVAHDADLFRTLGLPTVLSKVSWEQLQALPVGENQFLPPRLTTVLAKFPRALFNVEIKEAGLPAAQRLAKLLAEPDLQSRVLVASVHHEALVEFRKLTQGRVATSASGRESLRFYLGYRLGYEAPAPFSALQLPVLPVWGFDSPDFLRYVHSRGIKLHFWTIDDPQEQKRLIAAGADGIMTNYPTLVAATLKNVQVSPRQPQLVFLGDSLTAGYGLSKSEAIPALIQERLAAAGKNYRVINAGRSGDTSAGGLSRLDWYFDAPGSIAALVIGLGSNDAMRGLSLEAMEENLEKIIRKTQRRWPAAKVFLWELKTFPNLGAEYIADYAAVFPRVAERTGATLIPFPLRAVAGKPRWNQADGIHPNAEGTQKVADPIWTVLKGQL